MNPDKFRHNAQTVPFSNLDRISVTRYYDVYANVVMATKSSLCEFLTGMLPVTVVRCSSSVLARTCHECCLPCVVTALEVSEQTYGWPQT